MYEGYRTIINLFFPNATHIVDSFHYVRYITGAFNNTRIKVMNKLPKDEPEYKMLKNYWKVLLKYSKDLNYYPKKLPYNYIEKKKTSILGIIDSCLNISDELTEAYQIKERFLRDFRSIKYEEAKDFIFNLIIYLRDTKIEEYKKLLSMFCGWENEIINSFIRFGDKRLNNGYIEGMNNHIKVIKRISFGYRNFYRFRKRIMYIVNDEIKLK